MAPYMLDQVARASTLARGGCRSTFATGMSTCPCHPDGLAMSERLGSGPSLRLSTGSAPGTGVDAVWDRSRENAVALADRRMSVRTPIQAARQDVNMNDGG